MAELSFYNNSNELTLSADGITYGYIGRATPTALVQATVDTVHMVGGYSTYTIDWPADIVVALPLKTGGDTMLANVSRSGDTHTIRVYQTVNGTGNSAGFESQEYTEVIVFGAPIPYIETACCLFDNAGNVTADLTRRPLTYAGIVQFGSGSGATNLPLPAVSVPAIIGWSQDSRYTSSSSPPFHIWRQYVRGWTRIGDNIWRGNILMDWAREDAAGFVQDNYLPADVIIIEAAGL